MPIVSGTSCTKHFSTRWWEKDIPVSNITYAGFNLHATGNFSRHR